MIPNDKDLFILRSYSKSELAQCYFPTTDSAHTAVNHLMAWIKQCKGLMPALEEMGYRRTSKYFTPKQVACIVQMLGEP